MAPHEWQFRKGCKPGPGRPKGLKDRSTKNYLDLQVWASLIMKGAKDATSKEMIEIGFRGLQMLLNKVANIPGYPTQSVQNAEAAAALLKDLEVKTETPSEQINVNS